MLNACHILTNKMTARKDIFSNIRIDENIEKHLYVYMDYLLDSNRYTNLISRKITRDHLVRLVWETIFINPLISKARVVDAGSGNGLLGIPLAILDSKRPVVLVETKAKKAAFLSRLKDYMSLENVEVYEGAIGDYLKKEFSPNLSLVSRGFPRLEMLVQQLQKERIGEILMITSRKKMIKIKKGMERIDQKIYNIPFRDNIMIFKMENVSRET
jgi:16S rRNA (guanine(527)-N(7))-methyltransferase RsmG